LDRIVTDNLDPPGLASPDAQQVHRVAVALAALGQSGLAYARDRFDVARYEQAGRLAAELLAVVSGRPAAELRMEIGRDTGYATPKVDVRGVLFDDQERVLLLRERSDGLWSVPGGWADPGDTPSAAVLREVREETGYHAEVVKLVGCYDRDRQGHLPRLPFAVYKLFFLCRATGEESVAQALETLDIGWFALDELPPLSEGRVHSDQIRVALAHHRDPGLPTVVD
jgi:ADP-ribose pyrophosphatase YjhB (NUDIX family)